MGRKHPNPQRVKINRSYAVEEIARLLGIHKNTVRAWLKAGLIPLDDQKPLLVHGATLRDFLRHRRIASKSPCPPGHLYCFRCRTARLPAGQMAEYVPSTSTIGNIRALCSECEGWMYRRVNTTGLEVFRRFLDITITLENGRIGGSSAVSVKCDLGDGA